MITFTSIYRCNRHPCRLIYRDNNRLNMQCKLQGFPSHLPRVLTMCKPPTKTQCPTVSNPPANDNDDVEATYHDPTSNERCPCQLPTYEWCPSPQPTMIICLVCRPWIKKSASALNESVLWDSDPNYVTRSCDSAKSDSANYFFILNWDSDESHVDLDLPRPSRVRSPSVFSLLQTVWKM